MKAEFFRGLLTSFLALGVCLAAAPGWAQDGESTPRAGAVINRQTGVKSDAEIFYYSHRGVDLPLKEFQVLEGNHPLLRIVDGRNTLWVSEQRNETDVLDRILAGELEAMTGAGDEMYFRGRWSAALKAFERIYKVIDNGGPQRLDQYPAIRSYLLLREGQCHSWLVSESYADAQRDLDHAQAARRRALEVSTDPAFVHTIPVLIARAEGLEAEASQLGEAAKQHRKKAEALLNRSLEAHRKAARGNEVLYQAYNELGILSYRDGGLALDDGDIAGARTAYTSALDSFRQARSTSRDQEFIVDNIVAARSALADIEVDRGEFAAASRQIEEAMKVVLPPDYEEEPSYLVSFRSYHPSRGEEIVVRAPLEAGLIAKYVNIRRDRAAWPQAREAVAALGNDPEWKLWRKEGRKLLKAERWADAASFYEGLHHAYAAEGVESPKEFTDHIDQALVIAFRHVGDELFEQKRYDEAVALYRRARAYVPDSEILSSRFVTAAIGQADESLARGEWEEALHRLEGLKGIYQSAPGERTAEETSRVIHEIHARLAAAHLGLSDAMLAAGKLPEASAHADAALALAPERRDYRHAKARVLEAFARRAEAAGPTQWASALRYYDEAIATAPFLPRLRLAAGSLRLRTQVRASGTVVQRSVQSYGPFMLVVLLGLLVAIPIGRVAWSEGSRRRRVRALRRSGTRAYNEERWHDAIAALNDYRRLARTSVTADTLEMLARAYRRLGDFESALRHFDMAAARQTGRSYHLERCEIYTVRRNLSLATAALRRSASLNEDVERMIQFVNYLREREDKKDPFFAEAIAAFSLVGGDTSTARTLYLRLHERHPRVPRFVRQLADIARIEGDAPLRMQWLQNVVALDPLDARAMRELATLCAEAGDTAEALRWLEQAHELQPLDGTRQRINELHRQVAVVAAEQEIVTLIDRPRNPATDRRMAELYITVGKPHVAMKLLEPLLDNPEHGIHAARLYGLACYYEGQYSVAIQQLRSYITRRPNLEVDETELQARYYLGLSHEALGQFELAGVQYQAIYDARRDYQDVATRLRSPKFHSPHVGISDQPDVRPESSVAREIDLELDLDDDSDTLERED